jgi:hypothetical protein
MPAGAETIEPVPVPDFPTMRLRAVCLPKIAVTCCASFIVTKQTLPVPLHAPPHS